MPNAETEAWRTVLAGVVDLITRTPRKVIEVGGNEPPERSVAGMIAFLEGRGVALSLARADLVARSRDPMRVDVRELIEQAHELIVGHLQSRPIMCSTCAEPAVAVLFPKAPMCAEHAQ